MTQATASRRCRLLRPVTSVGVAVESWLGDEDPGARTAAVQTAVDSLNQKLRRLAGAGVLPLGLQAVVGAAAALRATAVPLPVPHALAGPVLDTAVLTTRQVPRRIEPLELMITLEGSGRWPDDPAAVSKTKTAFLLQVGKPLVTSTRAAYYPGPNSVAGLNHIVWTAGGEGAGGAAQAVCAGYGG